MKIKQVLNNNVVIATERNKEVIVIGTGLGFKAKKGERIEESRIQKVFTPREYESRLTELIHEIPAIYLEITEAIVEYGEAQGLTFSSSVYLQLTDHIYHAVQHEQQGIFLKNPMVSDIRRYYPTEYDVARQAGKIVEKQIGFELSGDELGFITLHIIETSSGKKKTQVKQEVDFVNRSIDYIRENSPSKKLEEHSLNFERLVVHLKFFARRYFLNEEFGSEDSFLDETIASCLGEELAFARQYAEYIRKEYGKELSRQEMNYLALHFRNVHIFGTTKEM